MKLTQSDVEKIKEEIEHRKLVVRPEAIEAVKEARAQGDLSENFEYYAAKKVKIVSTMRGDSISGRISSDSPMGAALMGHKVGDRVEVKVNEKVSYYVVIKSIENTGEEETDTIRTF